MGESLRSGRNAESPIVPGLRGRLSSRARPTRPPLHRAAHPEFEAGERTEPPSRSKCSQPLAPVSARPIRSHHSVLPSSLNNESRSIKMHNPFNWSRTIGGNFCATLTPYEPAAMLADSNFVDSWTVVNPELDVLQVSTAASPSRTSCPTPPFSTTILIIFATTPLLTPPRGGRHTICP